MATSRFQPRSISTTATCRACEGSGEHSVQPYGRPSPYDDAQTCAACNGRGRVEFRTPDVLLGLRYFRSYGRDNWMYRDTLKRAMRPARLPADRAHVALQVAA